MEIGVIKEPDGDNRVAFMPGHIKKLKDLGFTPVIEKGAGTNAFSADQAYEEEGAEVVSRKEALGKAQVLATINPLPLKDIQALNPETIYISAFYDKPDEQALIQLTEQRLTVMDLVSIPRISRAQMMDVLSSQANIAGYKSILLAAYHLPKFFPMLTTAAGSIPPAKVLVLGAGVGGLQAIATAKRLGGVVEAFDVRPEVKEEVESLGAKFLETETEQADQSGYAREQSDETQAKQQQIIHDHALKADVVITSAQIPGKKAPLLLTKDTVEAMKPGSLIVDLAASTGGNCEVTQNNQLVNHNQVQVAGYSNLPATLPLDASNLYGKNLLSYLKLMVSDGAIDLNFEDQLIQDTCLMHKGEVLHESLKPFANEEKNEA